MAKKTFTANRFKLLVYLKQKGTYLIIVGFLLFIAFDRQLFDLVFIGVRPGVLIFSQANYHRKEWLIVLILLLYITWLCVLSFSRRRRDELIRNNLYSAVPFIAFLTTFFYWIIRFSHNSFQFDGIEFQIARFSFLPELSYLDILMMPVTIISLWLLIAGYKLYRNIKPLGENKSSWVNDPPLTDSRSDALNRTSLASAIAREINSFSDKERSFSIGITGPWGSGKSSFLNFIKNEVERNDENLVIVFNPWQYPENANLTHVFLSEVKAAISKYVSNTSSDINAYMAQVLDKPDIIWRTFYNFMNRYRQRTSHLDAIKIGVSETGKRLVIILDDIDRLRNHEVCEILTIIRNAGDLPNTVFVIAYDKDYLLKIMPDRVVNPQEYLAKFIQVEYALSVIPNDLIINELIELLEIKFPDLSRPAHQKSITSPTVEQFVDPMLMLQSLNGILLLKNYRDVVKLMNNISITWPILKNWLYFDQFLKLEILRLKYGNVYSLVKNSDKQVITLSEKGYIFRGTEASEILEYLVPDHNDREEVIALLGSLFPDASDNSSGKDIRNPLGFTNYFLNSIFEEDLITTTTTTLENEQI